MWHVLGGLFCGFFGGSPDEAVRKRPKIPKNARTGGGFHCRGGPLRGALFAGGFQKFHGRLEGSPPPRVPDRPPGEGPCGRAPLP